MEADVIINIIQFKFKFHPGIVPYILAAYVLHITAIDENKVQATVH